MKKLLITAVAALGLVACSNDEILEQNYSVINFGSTFVDNATRAALDQSYNTNTLAQFQVYSTITNTNNQVANIFNGEVVSKKANNEWGYDVANTQYWIPGNTYKFWAIADGNVEGATAVEVGNYSVPTKIALSDASKQKDILAAYEQHTYASGEKTIEFTFKHLMSKVKFTVKNTIATDNGYSVKAKNIRIVDADKAADYVITDAAIIEGVWSNLNGTYELAFGNAIDQATAGTVEGVEAKDIAFNSAAESNWDRLLIPAENKAYTIKFDYELYKDGVQVDSHEKTVTPSNITLEKGNAYNFIISLGNPGEPIKFDVERVEDWITEGNNNLYFASVNGGKVTLTEDVVVTTPLQVKANMTIDLNGHTITAALKEEGRHHYAIDNYGTLTLEGNGVINARGIENFGTMTINGDITITNVDTNGGSAIWNEGNLVINSGTFTTNAQAGEGSYGSALNTQANGKAVVNGGTFIANSQLTYAICNYGETVINNATVVGKHGAVASSTGCNTVINGGSFSLMENPGVSDHCVYYVSDIKGGTFTLGNNTDSGAQVFCSSTIAAGLKAIENNGVWSIVSEGN